MHEYRGELGRPHSRSAAPARPEVAGPDGPVRYRRSETFGVCSGRRLSVPRLCRSCRRCASWPVRCFRHQRGQRPSLACSPGWPFCGSSILPMRTPDLPRVQRHVLLRGGSDRRRAVGSTLHSSPHNCPGRCSECSRSSRTRAAADARYSTTAAVSSRLLLRRQRRCSGESRIRRGGKDTLGSLRRTGFAAGHPVLAIRATAAKEIAVLTRRVRSRVDRWPRRSRPVDPEFIEASRCRRGRIMARRGAPRTGALSRRLEGRSER